MGKMGNEQWCGVIGVVQWCYLRRDIFVREMEKYGRVEGWMVPPFNV